MTDADGWTERDKEQIEEVFGLTGGELMDVPWILGEGIFRFWYQEPPEYAQSDYDWTAHEFRTVVTNIMFGEPPEQVDGWHRVGIYRNSGETECPGQSYFDENIVIANQCAGGDRCYLCDEKIGQEHGYIYLGDGWAEVVYQKDEES